jgi:hypothetical protein
MLIISYGIPKSGSTLTFELLNGMLASIGHKQTRLADGIVSAGHGINFLEKVNPTVVEGLLGALPRGGHVCVKTHARIDRTTFRLLEDLHTQRKVQVVASYRDPRDICLSLMDAGARARAKGTKAFSECTDLASVVPKVERQLGVFRTWAAITGALRLGYDLVAFSPDKAIDAIEAVLGIASDRAVAKRHAFEDAFTQKNKGVRSRWQRELSAEQQEELATVFDKFIRRVCRRNDDTWFTLYREKFLAQTPAQHA